ncbi:MAG: hypothetical protein ABI949_01510 [Ilumatobacteraceae bacterium]
MGVLLVFAAGYVMGARAGGESLDEVIDAMQAIRESDEFNDFVKALRTHAAHSLRNVATMLEKGPGTSAVRATPTDLLDRVKVIVGMR